MAPPARTYYRSPAETGKVDGLGFRLEEVLDYGRCRDTTI